MSTQSSRFSPVYPYQVVLHQEPTQWNLYKSLAALLPKPAEQSHILLKGAWHALERKEYKIATELSQAAHEKYADLFFVWHIDIELLKRQKRDKEIPKKLLEIAQLFAKKNLPAQELKAYKRLAQLDPQISYYEKLIALYTQVGKTQKAILWTKAMTSLPQFKAPQVVFKESTETKEAVLSNLQKLPDLPFVKVLGAVLSTRIKLPEIAFGKALWERYIGEVGEEPPLPEDIDKILEAPCPFWGGFFSRKKVKDTHLLVLIPETVNKKPLTLKTLGELVQKPLQGNATQYKYFVLGQYKDPAAPKSHWALLTRDVLPGSRNKSYNDQKALVAEHSQKTKLPYEVPTLLDAAVCLFMEYVRTGTRLYNDSPYTYTRCQEMYDDTWHLAVGGFAPGGLRVPDIRGGGYAGVGVGALRKF